jgi:hypothetical protein
MVALPDAEVGQEAGVGQGLPNIINFVSCVLKICQAMAAAYVRFPGPPPLSTTRVIGSQCVTSGHLDV